MAPEWSKLLVRYGEIGIKSPAVRARWEKRLVENVEGALQRRGAEGQVIREWGRMFVVTNDVPRALDALRHTFGVVSASLVEEVAPTLEAMKERAVAASRDIIPAGGSFAVRARRTGDHAFTSVDVQRQVGGAVFDANADRGVTVDLDAPDAEIFLEVREKTAYLYRDVVPGPGGLPLGTQGRVAVVLDSPRAALAAWLMMRRGCTPLFLEPSDAAAEPTLSSAADELALWAPHVRLSRIAIPDEWREDPARRRAFLLRAAGALARPRKGQAVVVSDGLLAATVLARLDRHAGLPVFRPLTGFEGAALDDLVRASGLPAPGPEPAPPAVEDDPDVPPEAVRDALSRLEKSEVHAA